MAWFIFRHTEKAGPLRFTASRKGLSASVGGRGWRVSSRTDGTHAYTVRWPGTGASIRRTRKGRW